MTNDNLTLLHQFYGPNAKIRPHSEVKSPNDEKMGAFFYRNGVERLKYLMQGIYEVGDAGKCSEEMNSGTGDDTGNIQNGNNDRIALFHRELEKLWWRHFVAGKGESSESSGSWDSSNDTAEYLHHTQERIASREYRQIHYRMKRLAYYHTEMNSLKELWMVSQAALSQQLTASFTNIHKTTQDGLKEYLVSHREQLAALASKYHLHTFEQQMRKIDSDFTDQLIEYYYCRYYLQDKPGTESG